MFTTAVKFLFNRRKTKEGKNFSGDKYRINAPGLRGSRLFHDPRKPKFDMFPNPDLQCINRAAIGRYGKETDARAFPLVLMRAAYVAVTELYDNPLDYSVTRRVDEQGKPRKIYSQMREAIAKVSATLIMHTSLEYGMVGKLKKGVFYHMSLKEIASHAGVHVGRAKRAMRILKEKGALTIGKQYEQLDKTTYEGHNSIRHLTAGFWAMLGLEDWKENERKKRSKAKKAVEKGEDSKHTALLAKPYKPKREVAMDNMQTRANNSKLAKEIERTKRSLGYGFIESVQE